MYGGLSHDLPKRQTPRPAIRLQNGRSQEGGLAPPKIGERQLRDDQAGLKWTLTYLGRGRAHLPDCASIYGLRYTSTSPRLRVSASYSVTAR